MVDGIGEGSCIGKAVPTRRFVVGAGAPFPGVPVRMRVRSEGAEPIDYPAVVRLPDAAPRLICVDQNPLFDEAPLEVAISPFLSSTAYGKHPGDIIGALMGIGMLGALFTNKRDTAKLGAFERTLDTPDFAGGMDHDPIFGQSTTSLVKLSVASRGGAVPIFRGRERVGTTSDSFYIAANALSEILVGPLGRGKPLKRCEKSDPKAYSFSC
ncbi:MAG: hypothetical protein WC729_28995 [Sphingomonas sp.]|uniref:hypothetical protein n=1 Tax=Sphingomonas sp. TaxID=28214 RepID=UPI003566B1E1